MVGLGADNIKLFKTVCRLDKITLQRVELDIHNKAKLVKIRSKLFILIGHSIHQTEAALDRA